MERLSEISRVLHNLRRSFWALPLAGCVSGVALAIASRGMDGAGVSFLDFMDVSEDTARALMGAVAGAVATIMSLTYTLTLVIFTLATGNLGPRLIDSFTDNRINQITIALLGCTFLHAMTALYLMDDRTAQATALTTLVLTCASTGMLVWFVHDVAQRILIDNEVARTAQKLDAQVNLVFRAAGEGQSRAPETRFPDRTPGPAQIVHAVQSGYLRAIEIPRLVRDMRGHHGLVELLVAPGEFVARGGAVALIHRGDEGTDWDAILGKRMIYGRARTSEGDLLFSVNLLVEIALRALSPGINDSFTAISCIDHLSGIFADLLRREPPSPYHSDTDRIVRVMGTVLGTEEIVGTGFHPIRRNAAGNILVCDALLDALARLLALADAQHHALLREHARLVAQAALPDGAPQTDRDHIRKRLREVFGTDAPRNSPRVKSP